MLKKVKYKFFVIMPFIMGLVTSCNITNPSITNTLTNSISVKKETHVVTFDATIGRFSDTRRFKRVTVNKYAKVEVPEEPTNEGYDFVGWFTENKLWLSMYNFDERVTSDFTIYAKYKELQAYNVTFNANGGTFYFDKENSSEKVIKVYEGKKVSPPQETPFKQGYTFLGWTLENNDNLFDFNNAINSDLTLYAKYE